VTSITLLAPRTDATSRGRTPSVLRRLIHRPRVWGLIQMTLMACLIVLIWPVQLGGKSTLTIVAGDSMEPTYLLGDAVITWKEAAHVGDVVLFRLPEGEFGAGELVIHRLVGGDGSGWITQGDNRSSPDSWTISDSDILGVAKFHVPLSGRPLDLMRSWMFMAALAVLTVATIVWPGSDQTNHDESAAPDCCALISRASPWCL